MSAGAPEALKKLFCLQQLRWESCHSGNCTGIDRLTSADSLRATRLWAGATHSWRGREGRGAWRAWAGGGASPADWVLGGTVSVRLRERERKCWLPEERQPSDRRSVRQHILRAPRPPPSGAAAALGEPGAAAAAAESAQVNRRGVSRSPAAPRCPSSAFPAGCLLSWEPGSSAAPAAAAGHLPWLPPQAPACSAAP